MDTEADTCRRLVVPKLQQAGWDDEPHSIAEQRTFTDGRIVVAGSRVRRRSQKRADFLLRHTRDFTIAVVEAKASYRKPADGLQQAKGYAETLGLMFAYSTNGEGIVEFDYTTGLEQEIDAFPKPADLWLRLRQSQSLSNDDIVERLLTPTYRIPNQQLRYYQEIAINRTVQAVLQGKRRILLTMATGTGKTLVAFQICWKLWQGRWNKDGEARRPRILYLADRSVLVDDPKDKTFAPFGDARHKIENGDTSRSRQIYFSTYQAIAEDESRRGLYREYDRDFFDLIIVDECHRGSARADSTWREILEYFGPTYQLGMTATPLRDETRDTYKYFGNPIYQYSLRQGIEDGFLAPYRVHRVTTTWDASGWRPSKGELDRYGQAIPDKEYRTEDFERLIALKARTRAFAQHLSDHLKETDRFAKTIVFCVDQEHALAMREALGNLDADLVRENPDYVCRVTADEGDIGRGHLSNFQDVERATPTILTTSQLLTTGVDAPTCKNVVLVRIVNSMTEFKQIIGRGTRVRDDYGKYYFTILDYTGSATARFADPSFDGSPALITEVEIDEDGEVVPGSEVEVKPLDEPPDTEDTEDWDEEDEGDGGATAGPGEEPPQPRRKYYVDGGSVEICAHLVYELDPDGKQLRVVKLTDYTAEEVRTLYSTGAELRHHWADPVGRSEVIAALEDRGIDFDQVAAAAGQPDADPFDLLCNIAYSSPLRTRRERADRVRREEREFYERYTPEARVILDDLLDKYADYGVAQFIVPDVLKIPPISGRGNVLEIARAFGGAERLKQALSELQTMLYAA
jgi:type I restriction enzyme, R subunit